MRKIFFNQHFFLFFFQQKSKIIRNFAAKLKIENQKICLNIT